MQSPHQPVTTFGVDLAAGERLLWSEKPDPFVSMASQAWIAVFALVWLLFVGSGVAQAITSGEPYQATFLLVFVAIGFYMLLAPLIEFRRASKTTYAITDHRLIITIDRGRSTKSIRISGINQVERRKRRNTVTLRIPTVLVNDGDGGQKVAYTDLYGLRDGERAYQLLTRRGS